MDRRKFLRVSSLSSAGVFMLNGHVVSAFSKSEMASYVPESVVEGRSLVLIQLRGGNDGLNMFVPVAQYDEYARLRPTIRINDQGNSAGITLDSTLPDEKKTMLHPSLSGLKDLYDQGKMCIVNSVGYPRMTKSHFAGRAYMFRGIDGEYTGGDDSGWMGRFTESKYDGDAYEDPLGIQLGSKKPSLGFQTSEEFKTDINLSEQNLEGYYNEVLNAGVSSPTIFTDDRYGENMRFLTNTSTSVSEYSSRITDVFNAGLSSRATEGNGSYPATDLADQLKTVATLVKGGCKSKIYLLVQDGYDTHGAQVLGSASDNNSHIGKHADLLKVLSDAVKAFQDDIQNLGIEEQIVSATFTEFGRKVAENGNFGTDHGNLGPMFVIGKNVAGGVKNDHVNLDGLVHHYPESDYQNDYRDVFTDLMRDHLGASDAELDDTRFGNFNQDRLQLIQPDQQSSSNNVLSSKDSSTNQTNLFGVFPNPVSSTFTISFVSKNIFRGQIQLTGISGETVLNMPQDFSARLNRIPLNISHLSSGMYFLKIYDGTKVLGTKKVMKL